MAVEEPKFSLVTKDGSFEVRDYPGVVVAEVTCFRRDILVGPSSGRVPKIGPGFEPFALIASNGEEIPVQVLSVRPGMERIDATRHYPDQDEVDVVRIAFESPQLPGLGFAAMTLGASDAQPQLSGADTTGERIENKFVTVQCSAMGRIGLIDRRSGERYPGVYVSPRSPSSRNPSTSG